MNTSYCEISSEALLLRFDFQLPYVCICVWGFLYSLCITCQVSGRKKYLNVLREIYLAIQQLQTSIIWAFIFAQKINSFLSISARKEFHKTTKTFCKDVRTNKFMQCSVTWLSSI